MAIPNPLPDPEEHGEDLLGGLTAAEEAQLAVLDEDMIGSPAAKLAAQLVPVTHDGGQLGRAAKPVVDRATRARDWARIWGPAVAGTAVATAAVTVLPLPGPLSLYVLAVAAFGWWHCAGRPGAVETVQMAYYAVADAGAWIRRHVEALSVRRARYETRRTTNDPRKKES
ncbi:hypothetical protein ACIO52_04560 [Nocardia sp. NPDC087230]|uniref:hypothetical protein n=1 Tax=Nocardia sp. NPDC087230 TaxID=3364331 RepID=UPI0037FA5DFE